MKFPKKARIPDQSEEDPCPRPTIETGFAELEDGCLLELIENPKDPGRNLLVSTGRRHKKIEGEQKFSLLGK